MFTRHEKFYPARQLLSVTSTNQKKTGCHNMEKESILEGAVSQQYRWFLRQADTEQQAARKIDHRSAR